MQPTQRKPFALIILDGFGYREALAHNPTRTITLPTLNTLFSQYPHVLIEASGEAVSLPKGQMGNSEVGHLHMGAGRKVPQDLTRINHAIQSGEFFNNPILKNALQKAKKNNVAVHVIGLLSDGGVHSHVNHLAAMMEMIAAEGIQKNYLHAICDGRDTPPKSALNFIARLDRYIISIIGRYYAMDRDQRLERTQKAYDLLTRGTDCFTAASATEAIQAAYARGETDEFISPTSILKNNHCITVQKDDVVIFMNFRADRARQLMQLLLKIQLTDFITLTEYLSGSGSGSGSDHTAISIAYPPLKINNTLGEVLSQRGLKQLRLAETEKYAHVTYFLNGGVEAPNKNEDRLLIPSPKIATYDLQPEMSAIAVTEAFVSAIENKQYDVIICNYANPDMIGHTGNEKAAEKALLTIDHCLARVIDALKKTGGEALITADHGNIELMYDEKTQQPHTAHTTNLVPLIYVGRPVHVIAKTGALDDVAPTMLYLMGLEKPVEMTGNVLVSV